MRSNLREIADTKVTISFSDKDLEEKLLPTLEELVSDLVGGRISVNDLQQFLFIKKNTIDESWEEIPGGGLFAVDSSMSELNVSTNSVPRYEKSFSEILHSGSAMAGKENSPMTGVCFICSDNHFARDCPQKGKKGAARRPRPQASLRYHVHSKKESDFKPGVISDELRKALNIGANDIPLFTYRMRILDYPPGWMEEAAIESSGINLYHNDSTNNSSEIASQGVTVQYDPDKLIDFPGFNALLPSNAVDECLTFGFPPMQPNHMKCFVQQHMPKVDTCPKRKRTAESSSSPPSKTQRLDDDMEIEELDDSPYLEFNPPLPKEEAPPTSAIPPPPPPPPDTPEKISKNKGTKNKSHSVSKAVEKSSSRSGSRSRKPPVYDNSFLSLKQLEDLKKKLETELKASAESNPSNDKSDQPSPAVGKDLLKDDSCDDELSSLSDCSQCSGPTKCRSEGPSASNCKDSTSQAAVGKASASNGENSTSQAAVGNASASNSKDSTSQAAVSNACKEAKVEFDSPQLKSCLDESKHNLPLKSNDQVHKADFTSPSQISGVNSATDSPASPDRIIEPSNVVDNTAESTVRPDQIIQASSEVSDFNFSKPNCAGPRGQKETAQELSNFSQSMTDLSHLATSPESPASRLNRSKSMTLGTPSVSRHSSFKKLPDYEKFSKNINTEDFFENLPNSTGTYKKMKKVLKKVKEKLNSLIR